MLQPTVWPVSNLRLYVQLCDLMTVNLRDSHLFRTTNKSTVSTSPFIGSAVANRLVQHLKTLGVHNGESMHSFRSGCSITLSLLGVTSVEVARHVGWRSLDTAEYYTQTKKVMNMFNTASVLASSTPLTPSGAVAPASSVAQVFREKTNCAIFLPLFLRFILCFRHARYFCFFWVLGISTPLSLLFALYIMFLLVL